MFIALLSALLIIMSRPNKPKLKTKPSNTSLSLNVQSSCTSVVTEKVKSSQSSHSLNLPTSSVTLQNANLDHSQLTSHAFNRQSPSTAAGSAKLKPSETSVSLDLQNTLLTTQPAVTNSVAIETPLNNEAFQTAHHQNKPELLLTLPSKDTLAIQDKEKPSTSSPNKRPTSPLIAYVQSLSPIKRSKRGSTPYFNIKLQTALATQPAVCFSRSKRSFFDEKAATKTALKIERYNTSQDGRTIFINDMTRLSSPATSEYNFQFVESYNSNTLTLQSILQNALDMDMIDVIAKVVYKDKESQIVGSMKLKKSTCYIADETANSKLILWENNIDDVDVGEVYCFNQIRLRRDKETVVLNSTTDTVITKKLDSDLTNLVSENITPSDESMELSLKVDYIYSIQELSRFKQCLHCQKKIQQVTASAIVKCDHCGHVLRNSVCKENLMVKFLVKKSDESDADFDHFVVFHEVLAQMIGTNVNAMDDEMIFEKLLQLDNFTIFYNRQNIVKRVQI